MQAKIKTTLLLILVVCLVSMLVYLAVEYKNKSIQYIEEFDDLYQARPLIFTVVYFLAYILTVSLFFPGTFLTLIGGYVFGIVKGIIVVTLAATIGATFAFIISRHIAKFYVIKKFLDNPKFKAIENAISVQGWRVNVLLRLSPIIPFNIMNFLMGYTDLQLLQYISSTFLGILPLTSATVYLGHLGRGELDSITKNNSQSRLQIALYVFGGLSTIIAIKLISRQASQEIAKYEQESNNNLSQVLNDQQSNVPQNENV